MLPVKKDVDVSVLSAAFRVIYYAALYKKEISEAQYITCRCDEPLSQLYQAKPPIADNPELAKFIDIRNRA